MTADRILVDSVRRLLGRPSVPDGQMDEHTWCLLRDAGMTDVGIAVAAGGPGGDPGDAAAVARLCGAAAAALPFAEHNLLAGWSLAASGGRITTEMRSVIPGQAGDTLRLERRGGAWRLDGRAERVPWARFASRIVALLQGGGEWFVVPIRRDALVILDGTNLAGEPRDECRAHDVRLSEGDVLPAPAEVRPDALRQRGALARALAMVGALESVLEITLRHVQQREQFGRPISAFQAVQHQVVTLAEQVKLAGGAVDAAVVSPDLGRDPLDVAVAKAIAGEAATNACAIAHQLHGAMGLTMEHELQRFTRRLLSWREEFGNERLWDRVIGERAIAGGRDKVWSLITRDAAGGATRA